MTALAGFRNVESPLNVCQMPLQSCRHPEWYAGHLTKGEPMNVRILLPRAPETIVWPVGVSLPNAGDDIHVSGHLSSLTVSKKTFHIVNGKVDTLTIHI